MKALHVVEASLGGVRAYLNGLAISLVGAPIEPSIAYAPDRADTQFWGVLDKMKSIGWAVYEIPMVREVSPASDARAAREIRQLVGILRPDVVHTHSSKAGALGRSHA